MNTTDRTLDDGAAVRLILQLIPEVERARVKAIADGDQALVCIGLGQLLGYFFGLCGDRDMPMQKVAWCGDGDEVGDIVRVYWQWLRDQVPTLH